MGRAHNALRIAVALAKRPRDVPRYAAHNIVARRSTMQLGLPWMPYAVIDFLDDWVGPQSVVYECGSGGSTLFFARRAGKVVSLESDEEWAEEVASQLRKARLANVAVRYASADFASPETLPDSDFYRGMPTEPADLIVVDSLDHPTHRARPVLFRRAEELVRPGGLVLVDDAWRYRQLHAETRATDIRTFRGVGPGTRRPQWTDVYFY